MVLLIANIEAFHLAFLRQFTRSVRADRFAIKGGCNLRFFFGSARYSEDMDLDITGIEVFDLRDKVMRILESGGLTSTVASLGIDRIVLPDLARAKQTETVQRFKVHLHTRSGESLATKIEFSRRGLDVGARAEAVLSTLTGAYKMPSLIVPHYTGPTAILQKIAALATRRQPEVRDVYDLFVLAGQVDMAVVDPTERFSRDQLIEARERAFAIEYPEYRDKVVSFLTGEDQEAYDSPQMWDEIRLVAVGLLDKGLVDG